MIRAIKRLATIIAGIGLLGTAALYLYTLPALRRLPKAQERMLDGVLTIDDAVRYLRNTGITGWDEANRLAGALQSLYEREARRLTNALAKEQSWRKKHEQDK